MPAAPLHLMIAGQVDHGKSTLIGRLLFETGSLSDAALQRLEQAAKKRGSDMEWAFALDSLQIERTQGITLDTTRIWLKRPMRDIILIDVPGHHELLRNMLTGATHTDAALLVVDVTEGLTAQTRKHAQILKLLNINACIVVINKMDAVDDAESRFQSLARDCADTLVIDVAHIVPISAKRGDNIVASSASMPWYDGAPLLSLIDTLLPVQSASDAPLRLPIQDVTRVQGERVITGNIASGMLKLGDTLYFSPGGSVAKLKAFKVWPEPDTPKTDAFAGEAVGLVLDTPVFADRGVVISHEDHPPLWCSRVPATLIWLVKEPLQKGKTCVLRLGTQEIPAEFQHMTPERLQCYDIGDAVLKLRGMAVVDGSGKCPALTRMVLCDANGHTLAAGFINVAHAHDERQALATHKSDHIRPYGQPITAAMFEEKNGHRGAIFWFSGLSGSGKSTLATELQKMCFARGKQVIILDGDNLRGGLCRDLGFSAPEREENLRRAAEVAKILADAGMIVITAFITPTEADRERVRNIAPDRLHHIYIHADIALCESRDAKGLYKLARAGKLADFTGVSAPFEPPELPDLVIDTSRPLPDCTEPLWRYIEAHTGLEKTPKAP